LLRSPVARDATPARFLAFDRRKTPALARRPVAVQARNSSTDVAAIDPIHIGILTRRLNQKGRPEAAAGLPASLASADI
jgi:predicted metalloprotease